MEIKCIGLELHTFCSLANKANLFWFVFCTDTPGTILSQLCCTPSSWVVSEWTASAWVTRARPWASCWPSAVSASGGSLTWFFSSPAGWCPVITATGAPTTEAKGRQTQPEDLRLRKTLDSALNSSSHYHYHRELFLYGCGPIAWRWHGYYHQLYSFHAWF